MSIDRNTQSIATRTTQLNVRDDSADLLDLAARAERALRPVAPAPEFRARLRDGLRMAAYHREMHKSLVRQPAETPWGWLVGAAALGSAAGLLTILLRARNPRVAAQVVAHE